jgi:hypothetical protein
MKQAASHSRLQSGNESTIKALFRRTFSPSTALGNAVIGFRLVGKVGIDMNATKESFAEITTRFEKLDAAAAAMSLSLLKILVYVAVRRSYVNFHMNHACSSGRRSRPALASRKSPTHSANTGTENSGFGVLDFGS